MSYKIPSKEYIDTRINSFNNGPKDVFDTVAELVSTNPDHGYIYLVLENGYWYFWDGEEWLQGGHYGTTPEIVQLKTDAQTAKTQAESARDLAVGAKNTAVTAKDNAVIAQGLAEDAKDEAQAIAGGVAGTYDTLVDLQTADPSHGSVYLVVADANWYYWDTNVSDWLAGGVYSNEPAIASLNARLDTLEGTGAGSVAKAIDDAVSPLAEVVDNNRLYSDSQYLALKAQADAQALEIQASRAELYNGYKILQFGSTDIIGKGTKADYSAIDVSANVVDGKLSMEQKGLTIRNSFTGRIMSNTTLVDGIYTMNTGVFDHLASISYNGQIIAPSQVCYIEIEVLEGTYTGTITSQPSSIFSTGFSFTGIGKHSFIRTSRADYTGILYNLWLTSPVQAGTNLKIKINIVNLTTLGLASITDTAILSKLLPYVDGTKNVGKMGVRVVGVNQIRNGNREEGFGTWVAGSLGTTVGITAGGTLVVGSDNSFQYTLTAELYGLCKEEYIPIDASARALKATAKISSGGINIIARYYDQNRVFISSSTPTSTTSTTYVDITSALTPPANAKYMRFYIRGTVSGSILNVKEISMIYGATGLTTYEPYQAQQIFLPAIGNSLPNGVADSIKTVADGWEHTKRMSTPVSVASGVAVNTTNYPTAKNAGQWVNELTAGGTEIGVVGTDSTTGIGTLRFELATPITTHYDLPLPTSGKTIHRFAGEEKIALYGTGLTFSENVLSVLSAVKFVAGVMTDITSLATITTNTVTFSGVNATDVVYVKVEHDVDKPLGVLEHTPAVSNTASRLAALEAAVFGG